MAVVGFDVGTFSSYIGVARAGGIETIANEYSDRCTPSFISLNEKSRSMGAASKQQAVGNFRNTVSGGIKRVLGRRFKDPYVQKELGRFFRPNVVEEDRDGNVVFRMSYMGEKQAFTATQLQAMLLTKLKLTAETALKTKVVDAVISVPVYFTDTERRALLDACGAAGLNCLRLINDTTAAALGYGITKKDLPDENDPPRIVLFTDLGYSAVQVAACAFHKGKLKVLATSCDQEVGGRDFDEVLAKHFSAEFRDRFKVDAEDPKNPKPYIRLLQECDKLKKLMSANTNNIPINIECFINDKDVSSTMNREKFEELSEHLLKKIENTLSKVLVSANLTPSDIHSVEVMGGASRVPSFKRLVTQVFSKEPSTTLNADEAVARGCALQCAILSPTFRVRDFSVTDCQTYPITVTWDLQSQKEESRVDVITQFHQTPITRQLTLQMKGPFLLSAIYTHPDSVPFHDPIIGQFRVNNVTPPANSDSSQVKVKVRINGDGIFCVTTATMKVEGEETMEVDDNQETTETTETTAAPPQTNGVQEEETEMHTEQGGEKAAEENGCDENGTAEKSEEAAENNETNEKEEEEKVEEKKAVVKKKKAKSVELPIDHILPQLSTEDLNIFTEKEGQMIMQDKLEKEKADLKNTVEEYVYDMRDKISNDYEQYMKEEDRCSFRQLLEDTENWLYEDGEDESKQVYIDKLAQLRKVGQPVKDRYREAEEWPRACEHFGAAMMHVQKFLDQYEAGEEKYAHLDKADVEKVQKCLEEKRTWWGPKMEAQRKIKPFESPVLTVSQIQMEKKALESLCTPIMTKAKPKPKPKPEPAPAKEEPAPPKEEPAPAKEEKKGEEPVAAEAASTNGSGEGAQSAQEPAANATSKQEEGAKMPAGWEMDVD